MATLLHIIASARGELSQSRQAGEATVRRLIEQDPTLTVIERDLGSKPVAHPDFQFVQASLMREAERGEPQRAALALSDALINELDAADFVMLSMPMHNFMLPSVLKAWLDYVVRLGRTFQITAAGKVGLLRDRPMRVLMTCGGTLGDGLTAQPDFVTPYLRYVFKTIGITNLQVLPLENLLRGAAAQAATQMHFDTWCEGLSLEWLK